MRMRMRMRTRRGRTCCCGEESLWEKKVFVVDAGCDAGRQLILLTTTCLSSFRELASARASCPLTATVIVNQPS